METEIIKKSGDGGGYKNRGKGKGKKNKKFPKKNGSKRKGTLIMEKSQNVEKK